MNKQDTILIVVLLIISVLIYGLINFKKTTGTKAKVYYNNNVVLTVDLTIDKLQEFKVEGYNGTVHIVAKKGKIKVESENSLLHLCSKQGYISTSLETIVCLPNKIVIKIIDDKEIDAIVR